MKRYIIRRLAEMVPTTLGILVLAFLLFYVVGGSPAEIILGKNATAEALAIFDARYGYDKPLLCGHWSETRALDALALAKAPARDTQTQLFHLSLLYALMPGKYQLNASRVLLSLRESATGVLDEIMLDGPEPLSFTVRDGWRVTALAVGGAWPEFLRLRKSTAGFFDSQFVHYISALVRGDFGVSTEHQQPVVRVLRQGLGPSLALTIPILLGGTVVGIMLGLVCAAWRGGRVDQAVLVISTILMSVNYVIWVLAGQFFLAFKMRLFPLWGFESAYYLILPIAIGIMSGLGRDVRFYRTVLLDELYKPYVRTAQAKGVSGVCVMLRHVLRNSLIPIVTYVTLAIPFLFTGSLLLESFFGIPGLGNVSLNAIHSSDMAVVRAVVIIGALAYQVVHLLTDLSYAWLDPRVRLR